MSKIATASVPDAGKGLYERLDTLFAALPEIHREEFAELTSGLAAYWVSAPDKHHTYQVVRRWRRDHGFPEFR